MGRGQLKLDSACGLLALTLRELDQYRNQAAGES